MQTLHLHEHLHQNRHPKKSLIMKLKKEDEEETIEVEWWELIVVIFEGKYNFF